MRNSDRFLTGIVVAIAALVVVAFAVALRQPARSYLDDAAPADVVHNYLLALELGDFERAYGYLSDSLGGRPGSVAEFREQVGDIGEAGAMIETTFRTTSDWTTGPDAFVTVHETVYHSGGLFDSGEWESSFDVRLQLEDGQWRIVASDRYWDTCWQDPTPQYCQRDGTRLPTPSGR
jgi:hypothetical protein